MKIISAHQPAFFPWLGLFHKILLCDEFVVMDDVQFEKNSFINRNKIKQGNTDTWLTIPVITKDYKNKRIKDIEIANDIWKVKHLKTIEQLFSKSPYFNEIKPIIDEIYALQSRYLVDYTNLMLVKIIEYLKINTKVTFASDLSIQSKKLDYVIELTKKTSGNVFVFGALGKDYADKEILLQNRITPYFQDYSHPQYKQLGAEFIPYMSILDLLFNHGTDSLEIIGKGNITKQNLIKKTKI